MPEIQCLGTTIALLIISRSIPKKAKCKADQREWNKAVSIF